MSNSTFLHTTTPVSVDGLNIFFHHLKSQKLSDCKFHGTKNSTDVRQCTALRLTEIKRGLNCIQYTVPMHYFILNCCISTYIKTHLKLTSSRIYVIVILYAFQFSIAFYPCDNFHWNQSQLVHNTFFSNVGVT